MRRPQRRLHVLLWLLTGPLVAAGPFFAAIHAPGEATNDASDDALMQEPH